MTILTPLLGLRIRCHTGIISVYLRVMMMNIIRILRIIQDLAPDTLLHSGLWSLGIGHTGNPSDHKHSAHRLQSVRPDSVVRWSNLLNRTLLGLRSELEQWSASLEPDIVLMLLVHHRGITAHIVRLFSFVMLTQVKLFRLRCSGIVSGFVSLLRLCLSETS